MDRDDAFDDASSLFLYGVFSAIEVCKGKYIWYEKAAMKQKIDIKTNIPHKNVNHAESLKKLVFWEMS